MTVISHELQALIDGCVRGDPEARSAFQNTYGELIYTFPQRMFHVSAEEAGDYYLYVLEKDRIFARIRSFEGRNAMQFETYLSYYVLRDLFLEWARRTEAVETVSLDRPIGRSDAGGERTITVQDVLADAEPTPETAQVASHDTREVTRVLQQLEAEKRLVLKLLALGTVDLEPDDIRVMAQMASCSIRETLERVEEVVGSLAAKASRAQEKWQTLHTVGYWIHTYQRRITALQEQIDVSRLQGDTPAVHRLTRDKAELERKLAWRYRQQATLRQELQKFEIRPSYKDIASILNVPLGTICSRIARAREEFGQRLGAVRDEHA